MKKELLLPFYLAKIVVPNQTENQNYLHLFLHTQATIAGTTAMATQSTHHLGERSPLLT
jgi:hypothetical protein